MYILFFLMNRRPPRSTRTDTLVPYTTLFRSVHEVDPAVADDYFASRSRDSQLGALASDQSRPLASRGEFLTRIAKVTARHLVGSVPRPPHWTGFCLDPQRMEFWMDRPFRLHDRRP